MDKKLEIGDIIGMSKVTELKDGGVWGLEYIGKEYIVKRADKYLSHIHTDANTGSIKDTWSSEKWAKHFRPRKAGIAVGDFSIETLQTIYKDIEIIEIR